MIKIHHTVVELIAILLIVALPLGYGFYTFHKYAAEIQRKAELQQTLPHVVVPKFKHNDCFTRNIGPHSEAWETLPDGIVVLQGDTQYVVMYRLEAERHALTKVGFPVEMAGFDATHNLVECPKGWIHEGNN